MEVDGDFLSGNLKYWLRICRPLLPLCPWSWLAVHSVRRLGKEATTKSK